MSILLLNIEEIVCLILGDSEYGIYLFFFEKELGFFFYYIYVMHLLK